VIAIESASVDSFKALSGIPDLQKAFPLMSHPRFCRSITGVIKVVEDSQEKGLIVHLRPFGEFRAFGARETMLIVYPEFQRQGVGRAMISLLKEDQHQRFFVSAAANFVSTAFFRSQPGLILAHENLRYRIYKLVASSTSAKTVTLFLKKPFLLRS
jgi:GNAT superfamily N-acetyltransferase